MADPRASAARNVAQVMAGRSLDAVLEAGSEIEDRDRALTAELSYGVCRWFGYLDHLVGTRLQKPLRGKEVVVHALLLVGAYQLLFSRVPAHAAISSSVDAVRYLKRNWATRLVNGVLRSIQREVAPGEPTAELSPTLRYAQPGWFVDAVREAWPQACDDILAALQTRAPMTLRVNPAQYSRDQYADLLGRGEIISHPVAAVASALSLEQPCAVTALPDFTRGAVSVQDAGAQLAATLLDPQPGQRVLDACAAPGGKTGHLLELGGDINLTALDVDGVRLQRVAQNLDRLGRSARLCTGDAAQPQGSEWADAPYHRILADVPCSATGVMRRHPDIRILRRAEDIPALAVRQAAILDALWSLLAPGGKLLYVTCSLLPQENEQQVERFLARRTDARAVGLPTDWGHARGPGRQTLPGEQGMDGFFFALLERSA